jgi:hypothetical protein
MDCSRKLELDNHDVDCKQIPQFYTTRFKLSIFGKKSLNHACSTRSIIPSLLTSYNSEKLPFDGTFINQNQTICHKILRLEALINSAMKRREAKYL